MTKLTQVQQDLLRAAALADGGAINTDENLKPTAQSLIKRGLIISIPRTEGRSQLLITDAGRAEIGTTAAKLMAADQLEPDLPSESSLSAPKGKIGALVRLLRQPEGATIDAMMSATGWQAHSVRGALSGSVKKKLGLTVESAKTDGARVYRICEVGA